VIQEDTVDVPVTARKAGGGTTGRRLAVLACCLAVLLGSAVLGAASASAHASLLFATPAVGASVPSSPTALTLDFDEPVTLTGQTVRLSGTGGAGGLVGPARRGGDGSAVTAAVPHPLTRGVYTVTWQVIAQDGDGVTGSYQFAVGPAASGALSAAGAGQSAGTVGQSVTAVLRWVLFAALSLVAGEAAAERLASRRRPEAAVPLRPWTFVTALVGLVTAVGLAALIVGDGALGAAITHPAPNRLGSRPGVLALVEVAAFGLAAALARRRRGWAAAPLAAVVIAEALRGHPQTYAPGWGFLATAVHLVAAALWVGALVYVIRCALAWRERPGRARGLFGDYGRMAAWLFAAVVASGVLATVITVPLSALLGTGYGRLLLVKLTVVAGAAGCALAARWRLRRRASGLPLRLVRGEAVLLAGALAAAAGLTSATPPRTGGAALAIAPAPSGPVLPTGARAGQLGVNAAASTGQLVIRLTSPGDDARSDGPPTGARVAVGADEAADGRDAGLRLAATLAQGAGTAHPLALRGCGSGCFVAPVSWRPGADQLTLRAASSAWTGGTVALTVPWPARPDPQALQRTARLLRTTGKFTLYERVTSDTSRGPGHTRAIPLTGAQFLASEPYSSGRMAQVDAVPGPGGTQTLLLGDPAQNIEAALDLGADGQVRRETLTAPNELITRTFVYPEEQK
jgi:copper transport protein